MVILPVILDHPHAVNGRKMSLSQIRHSNHISHSMSVAKRVAIFGRSQALIANCTRDGTRCGGIDTTLAPAAWTPHTHLLRWCGNRVKSICYGGESMQLEIANTKFVE